MMDKSAASGGPPSYTNIAASSSAVTEAMVSGTSGLSLERTSTTEQDQTQDQELPRGVTLKEAHDPTSVYSYTKVALELPLISSTKRIAAPPAQSAPLPPYLLQCTLFASYDINAPHPVPFRQVGCPATHARGQTSASSNKVAQSVSKLRKRLGVQIPLAYLGGPGFDPDSAASYSSVFAYLAHQQPRNGAEMTARSGNISRYRKVSLFQAQAKEMTGIVSRPLVERVLSALYAGQGIYDRMAMFPAEAVLRYSSKSVDADADADEGEPKSGWLSKLKSKAKGKGKVSDGPGSLSGSHAIEQVKSVESVRRISTRDDATNVRFVKAGMVFATLDLLAPPPRLLETGGPYPVEMNKASDADMSTSFRLINEFDRATDEERFQRFMFAPTAADDQLFANMLRALERRGGIWVEAGRLITPSSRNPNPRERARFLVKGLFPERFVYRCKHYRARKFEPMPSDLDSKEVKRFGSPLIVHVVQERTGQEGIDLRDYVSTRAATASTTGEDGEARLDWEWDEEDNLTFDDPSATNRTQDGNAAPPPDYKDAQKEMLNGYGIESPRAQALIEAEQDFFQGWSVGYTEEPFRNGNWMESIGTGSALWFAASGM